MHDHSSHTASATDQWVPRRPLDVAPPDQFWPVAADSRIDLQASTTDETPELLDDRASHDGVVWETPADADLSPLAEVSHNAR